ncbi:uncharacterized protein Triagg1_9308 [Trichoderma aggressivum f. europaeum]|uniref:Uncharacterized protein n=1 Tax=Trichoderma aggressivum f. europaeum TaxID=173218 RepID=A0AAE1I8Q0_9HYPO|nr:hypothetical protein Triagg1_9308 [Trichoderma aggressivum f. europaeum]
MSGFGDDEKLRAARELAQSFSRSKPPKKKNVGGSSFGPRQVIYVPQHHQPMPKIRQPPVTKPILQNAPPSISSVPPPSMRNYSATASFSTGRAGKSVIGTSGLDFLKASGDKARVAMQPQPSPVTIAVEATSAIKQTETIKQTEKTSNATLTIAPPPTLHPQAPESAPIGNILDAFLSIVAKKPSLGQEIDTLASIFPKAMDLNATEPAASGAPPTNGHPVGDTSAKDNNVSQGPSVAANQDRLSAHSPSNKASHVATAVVSSNGKAKGQAISANGVSKASVTVTKGLAASSWA